MLLYREIKLKLKRFQFELSVEKVGLHGRSKQKHRQHIVQTQSSNLLLTCMDFFVLSLRYFSNDPTVIKKIFVNVTGRTDVCNFFM